MSDLKAAIRRKWRSVAREEMEKRGQPLPEGFSESEPTDGDMTPPDPQRIARRAACLGAVALRGMSTQWPEQEEQEMAERLRGWIDACEAAGLKAELEDGEMATLGADAGQLEPREALNATWRWEGAAALAWALARFELPSFDMPSDPKAIGDAVGLLHPPEKVAELVRAAKLADGFDAEAFSRQCTTINWRLRQFLHVEQKHLDFEKFAAGVTWMDMTLDGTPLAAGDLAIDGRPIAKADPATLQAAMSVMGERHFAANWLLGWDPVYSEVDTPT